MMLDPIDGEANIMFDSLCALNNLQVAYSKYDDGGTVTLRL